MLYAWETWAEDEGQLEKKISWTKKEKENMQNERKCSREDQIDVRLTKPRKI